MALPLHPDALRLPVLSVSITSGGILWRRAASGEIEVCLSRASDRWSIPRGPVHEDERLEDAAIRHVQLRSRRAGRTQRRFERVTLTPGEHCFFFLLRGTGTEPLRGSCEWVPLSVAIRTVATEGERRVLLEALDAIAGTRSAAGTA